MSRLALVLTIVCAAGAASAQPMMLDPSKMSGIPRPDPQVPAGTITVRLIRGQLQNRMVGIDVTLAGGGGQPAHQKTDAEGRATFAGLTGGASYLASAKEGEVEMKSQPIELDAQMGSRVMLVFPLSGAGAADGAGHGDKTLPPGSLVVRAEDGAGQAAEGLDVVVGVAKKGEQKIAELKGKTDVAGEVRFDKLDHDPQTGYLVEVRANGAKFTGKPFKLDATEGARVVIQVHAVSADTSALTLGEGSHILCEIADDSLQVIEVLRVHNAGTAAVDVGGDGFHFPLPAVAVQLTAGDGDPRVSIVGHDAVFHGPIPPGDTQFRAAFVLAREGSTAEILQPTPIPFARVVMVTQQLEGLVVEGHNVAPQEREMQGRKLYVYFGDGTERGGTLHLAFSGLPAVNSTPRFTAAAIVGLIVLVLGFYALGGDGGARSRLERERRRLFDEVARLDGERVAPGADVAKVDAERERHVARLAELYRSLDELGGG